MTADDTWRIHNEFASVTLRIVPHGRGTRLQISAGRIETTGAIDATVLEALTLLSESQLAEIVAIATDPGNVRSNQGPMAGSDVSGSGDGGSADVS